MWARPGSQSPPTEPAPQGESPTSQVAAHEPPAEPVPPTLEFPADSPYEQPPSLDPTNPLNPVKTKRRLFRDPVSIILVLVIVVALAVAGLIGGELYARHRADNVVAAATECVVHDQATVSFGPYPFLLQHIAGHYRDISIHTAGHQLRSAKGMKADITINDVDLHGSGDSKGTIGALDATITWTSDGIKETSQSFLPFVGSLVNGVTSDPGAGTVELSGVLGSITVKPAVANGGLSLQAVKVTALGSTLPRETVQTALDAFAATFNKQYPLGIHADSVQVTNDGVVAHFSTRNASIPASHTDPCFAHV
jgi:DUF2993 family protein